MRYLTVALASLALLHASPSLADAAQDAVASEQRPEEDRVFDEGRNPVDVLRFADPQAGDVVADWMAGDGYYSALIADMVGQNGAVYALNPEAFHTSEVWQARIARHGNIRAMGLANRALVLPPNSVDMIFTNQTFHDIYWVSERFNMERIDDKAMLANWFAALKPGGHVIVIDHVGAKGDTREIVQAVHRIDPAAVVSAMEDAGFELAQSSDMLRRNDDDISLSIFDAAVRAKTDRFALKFRKPVN